jgi:membrane associated rhomboid family serine protease
MLIPLRHENMRGRRWPIITIGLIALNVFIFFGTHSKMDEQGEQEGQVKAHVLLLAAMHPELKVPDDVQGYVRAFETGNPALWKHIQNPDRRVEDAWDAKIRLDDDLTSLQEEMDSLAQQFLELRKGSLRDRYAFLPGEPKPSAYLTANFLHAGWLHLIGNMWFLWLAGFILEDTWGRLIYPILYLIAGAVALQVHAWSNPGSMVATIGASGAVAALMGAFLTRFPTMKIEMVWLLGLLRVYRFRAAAYWLLPLWLLTEIFYGALFGQASGVAHWAHVGGFVFGAAVGYGIRKSGLEQVAEKGIQEKIAWVSHPLLAEANEQLEKGQLDAAVDSLNRLVVEDPDSIDAHRMLQQIYWRKNDLDAHRVALEKLCALQLKRKETQDALQSYEEYRNSGGSHLPAPTWLDLCRQLEDQRELERGVIEYEALASAYPATKQSLLAQMAAGRLCLKCLNDPHRALLFYQAAAASSVPHLDWDANIQKGIEDARRALVSSVVPAR